MISEHSFTLGEKTYSIRFTARARLMFERAVGYPMGAKTLRLADGIESDNEYAHLLWSGLEGQRAIAKDRAKAWTLEDALDIVNTLDAGERKVVSKAITDAWLQAFVDPAKTPEAATSEEGKPKTTD